MSYKCELICGFKTFNLLMHQQHVVETRVQKYLVHGMKITESVAR